MTEITLTQTCDACPEQYDAYIGDERVAYLRLRHGHFTVQCPPGGEVIYEAYPNGDGYFYAAEREHYLSEARLAIAVHRGEICPGHPSLKTTQRLVDKGPGKAPEMHEDIEFDPYLTWSKE